jgi:fatty acid-binding protein DegV
VKKVGGTYVNYGQVRSLEKAIAGIAEHVQTRYAPGTSMRFQVLHGHNPAGAASLRERLASLFRCHWLPTGPIAPVLGAHTGPGLVGLVYAPESEFPDLP